jgi:hypothetical protein
MPARKTRRAAASEEKESIRQVSGWRTTDEHEIQLRRERGAEEIAMVEKLDDGRELYGAYRVPSASGEVYVVEIRSFTEPVNSCGCADHRANGLGTCKHVEGVLHRLRGRRGYAAALRAGNPRTELFLDPREGCPAVQWAARPGRRGRAERIVEASCSADGRLIGAPRSTLSKIQDALRALRTPARDRVRVSRYLEDWIAAEQDRESARRSRLAIERDLEAGKPALDLLDVPLYPYQQQGVLHLAFTRRAILADEMGLGKTIQAIAACELLAQREGVSRVLVVTPASLKGEWAEQIAAFTGRSVHLVDGTARARRTQYRHAAFFHLANYEQVRQDVEAMNELLAPEIVILDEAQRIKNWRTRTATQVKRLRSRHAFVLTGTPLENRIDEVYSIVQFLDPTLFGSLFQFNREFYLLDDRGRPAGYRNLDEMHRRLQPVMLRRRKADVEGDLPGRSVTNHFVALSPEQQEQYDVHQSNVVRLVAIAKRRPLRKQEFDRMQQALACMRMACDTPFILDELEKLLDEFLAGTSSKAVVFSEWERMLVLARERTVGIAPDSAWHTGSTPQKKRRSEIRRFKEDPACRILFSTDSGSVGLNLQVADVVINLDLPWNPAKLEQRIARAWRKHQRSHVRVVNLVSEGTIEHRMLGTLEHKRQVAESVIDGLGGEGTVPLRSGRAALIERVEALAVIPEPAPPSPSTVLARLEGMLEDALGERLVAICRSAAEEPAPVLLVVVTATDEATRQIVDGCVEAVDETPRPRTEVVDAPTWHVIERLVQSGFLSPGFSVSVVKPSEEDSERLAWRRERDARARRAVEAAQRQHAMARLLVGGGFEPEAVPALREAFSSVLEGLVALSEDECTPARERPAVAAIVNRFGLPCEFEACRNALEEGLSGADSQRCLSVCKRALELVRSAHLKDMG